MKITADTNVLVWAAVMDEPTQSALAVTRVFRALFASAMDTRIALS